MDFDHGEQSFAHADAAIRTASDLNERGFSRTSWCWWRLQSDVELRQFYANQRIRAARVTADVSQFDMFNCDYGSYWCGFDEHDVPRSDACTVLIWVAKLCGGSASGRLCNWGDCWHTTCTER